MAQEATGDQLHVLVIDDDQGLRALLTEIITREGHIAVSAESAEEGLEQLPFWTFQVAFLDFNLPGMDGLVLGEYLRNNNPDMTIALVTGEEDRSLPRRTRELHIRYVPKPFEVSDIVRILEDYREAAEERHAARQAREDADFEPPIARFADDITAAYAIPKVPKRIEGRLVETLKRSLNSLRSVSRYTERDRVVALSGLLTARTLGIQLPAASSGGTLYEEYDELMRLHGRRTEFGEG